MLNILNIMGIIILVLCILSIGYSFIKNREFQKIKNQIVFNQVPVKYDGDYYFSDPRAKFKVNYYTISYDTYRIILIKADGEIYKLLPIPKHLMIKQTGFDSKTKTATKSFVFESHAAHKQFQKDYPEIAELLYCQIYYNNGCPDQYIDYYYNGKYTTNNDIRV